MVSPEAGLGGWQEVEAFDDREKAGVEHLLQQLFDLGRKADWPESVRCSV